MKSYDEIVEIYAEVQTEASGDIGPPDGTFVAEIAGMLAELEDQTESMVRKLIRLSIRAAQRRQASKDVKDPNRLGPPRPSIADLREVLDKVGTLQVSLRDAEDRS